MLRLFSSTPPTASREPWKETEDENLNLVAVTSQVGGGVCEGEVACDTRVGRETLSICLADDKLEQYPPRR